MLIDQPVGASGRDVIPCASSRGIGESLPGLGDVVEISDELVIGTLAHALQPTYLGFALLAIYVESLQGLPR